MKPLIVQFSGGRTSGFLARCCQQYFQNREMIFLFENTGREDERTLKFVLDCDREWDLRVTWLEAVVHPDERKASSHKVVDFESASRSGEPYEAVIAKYGLANMVYTHCTRELKLNPKTSYLKSIGLNEGDYETAIGIRADEKHRISDKKDEQNLIYPLIDIFPVNKKFILNWWKQQPFDLETPEYLGNCDFCFKKDIKNLVSLARDEPHRLDWWEEMQKKYATTGANARQNPRQIFRGYLTPQDIREMAKQPTLLDVNPELEIEYDCFCKAS